ncbi:MAG: serine acetyltransferase [Paludibacteraceae bacterium]|nr:serine acetyltransferase [Paludibacteraceae bacterium]
MIDELKKLMREARRMFFPEYYSGSAETEQVFATLLRELVQMMQPEKADEVVEKVMAQVPELKRLLQTDVDAVMHNDPAVTDRGEVILCYPLTQVMMHYRLAHVLYQLGVPRLPRMLTEMAHSRTGIDIHPAAQIGEYFCIDHGTGVVIGETTIIGDHVVLYQGVTLGAKNFHFDKQGMPINEPRHPILEDHVTVYSNTSILGRVRIGHDTVIGGNVWLTVDVPANSTVLQSTPEVRIHAR